MFILKYKNIFLIVSALAVVVSLFLIFTFGFKKSIDFTGGAKVTVSYSEPIASPSVISSTLSAKFGEVKVEDTDGKGQTYKLTLRDMKESDYETLRSSLETTGKDAKIGELSMVGPSISSEVTKKAVIGFVLVVLAIIAFVTMSFFGVSYPVTSFKYGVITIIALIHDTIIPAGVFAWLGKVQGVEVDSLFVVALLTILGVSVSDTIVIFDRIRENLKNMKGKAFEEVVGMSLDQSLVRSLATSVSVIAVLLALFFFGPVSTKYFALTLTIGMFVGTYSSIFVASPLLVLASKYFKTKENKG